MPVLAGRACVFLPSVIVCMESCAMQEEQLREARLSEDLKWDKLNDHVMQQMEQQSQQP